MLDGDRRRLELAYSLMFTLPGTPVIRYGDEIGMGDDLSLPERDCARTPMQWSNEPHGGFTKSDKPVVPVISDGPYGYEHVNAAAPAPRPELAAELDRAHHPHAQGGAGGRLGRLRGHRRRATRPCWSMRYDWRNNSVLFVHNFGQAARGRVRCRSARPRGPRAGESADRGPQHAARTASIACCSRHSAIGGIGSAGSTTCSSAATSRCRLVSEGPPSVGGPSTVTSGSTSSTRSVPARCSSGRGRQ